ncbi:hypothetical protein ACJ3XI_08570 [Litorimonas sp. RW-G-Af-16]
MMNNEPDKTIDEVEAKGGRRVKGMTSVLALSTLAAVIGGILILVFFSS